MEETLTKPQNPLAVNKISSLIAKFAIPAILGNLVSALYNIVDQVFIGNKVNMLAISATTVVFPISTVCTAIALLLGVGSASGFNLNMGRGDKEKAGRIAGSGISLLLISGLLFGLTVIIFLKPIILLLGATNGDFNYTMTYAGITAFGIPFLIISIGGSHLIRADGSPTYSMMCIMTGAVLNIGLDYIFMSVFEMGIAGAALATSISQAVSGLMTLIYFFRFKTIPLLKNYFRPRLSHLGSIASLGSAACFNQLAMALVQIVMNKTLVHHGALSEYGEEIPKTCVGVITKVNFMFFAFPLGIAQGCQPIVGYNYGAKNYKRVKDTLFKAIFLTTVISVIAFLIFQIFPRQILSLFGEGDELYYKFAIRYFRIFMMMTLINGIQPVTSNFFTSIGKARKGIFLSLTRQLIFLLPLILIFSALLGIDGIMYAGPIADFAAGLLAFIYIAAEAKRLKTSSIA